MKGEKREDNKSSEIVFNGRIGPLRVCIVVVSGHDEDDEINRINKKCLELALVSQGGERLYSWNKEEGRILLSHVWAWYYNTFYQKIGSRAFICT